MKGNKIRKNEYSELTENIQKIIKNLPDDGLYKAYSNILKELRKRGIIRSKNVIGDLGEYLAIRNYNDTPGLPNLSPAPTGTQNVDALSRKGDRYSIKTTTGKVTGVFYGFQDIGSNLPEQQKFEYVIIVLFDENLDLKRINELSWEDFLKYKRWHKRMRAWNLNITRELLENTKTIFTYD